MSDKKKLITFGTSGDPYGNHHDQLRQIVSQHGRVVVIPCGPRPDKMTVNDTLPVHRAAIADMALAGIPGVEVALFDLENGTFTPTHVLDQMYRDQTGLDIWHFVGGDQIAGGQHGKAKIQTGWARGMQDWNELQFIVTPRPDIPFDPADLPPRHILLEGTNIPGSSTDIRHLVYDRQPIDHLVRPRVADYIDRHGLYRNTNPFAVPKMIMPGPIRPFLYFDPKKEKSQVAVRKLRQQFDVVQTPEEATCVFIIGGDGTAIWAFKDLWQYRLPFVPINAGTRGNLLNHVDLPLDESFFTDKERPMDCYHLPMLWWEVEDIDGRIERGLNFNNVWIERQLPAALWLDVYTGDGKTDELGVWESSTMSSGYLVTTAAGATGRALSMHVSPPPLYSKELILIGDEVREPGDIRPQPFPPDTVFEFVNTDPRGRPARVEARGDNTFIENVVRLRVRASRIAAVESVYFPGQGIEENRSQLLRPWRRR